MLNLNHRILICFVPISPGVLKDNDVVFSCGGKLNCKNIAQIVGPKNAANISTSIEKVLNLSEHRKAVTMSIPTIGTGDSTEIYYKTKCSIPVSLVLINQSIYLFQLIYFSLWMLMPCASGKGGIEPKDSIKAILKGLESHISQMPSSSIKIIFIVAFEQKIFDLLRDYFNERNLGPHNIEQVDLIHLRLI